MLLKRERPETDDFAIKKIYGCERKILSRNDLSIHLHLVRLIPDRLMLAAFRFSLHNSVAQGNC